MGLACGPVSSGGLEVSHWVADSRGWVSRAPYSTSCLLGLADSSRVLVDLSAPLPSCFMSADFHSRPSCPLPLGAQAPCLQSFLSSVLCPSSSARVHLQHSAFHLASLLPQQHLHRTAGAPALLRSPISPLVPQLPSLPSCSHLFPAHVLLGLLSWFSPNTPSHQLVVLSSDHFFPAPCCNAQGSLSHIFCPL